MLALRHRNHLTIQFDQKTFLQQHTQYQQFLLQGQGEGLPESLAR